MDRLTENKLVMITRRTRLDDLIARFNTIDQAKFYVEHLGADFSDYRIEDETYKNAVQVTARTLERLGRLQVIDRAFVPKFIFGPEDTVIALGQDGLVANVLKYLDGQKLLGVNPDPARWEGVLLPFQVGHLFKVLPEVFAGQRAIRSITMAEARLNTGEILRGVNDIFVGPRTHTSARYSIRLGDRIENQSSSGIIVSTGLGSTGWLRSVIAGATGIAASLSGRPVQPADAGTPNWEAEQLVFSVREPWPSKTSSAGIVYGRITPAKPLRLVSQMPEHGVIFSDGIEADYLQFNSGTQATISLSARKGRLVT